MTKIVDFSNYSTIRIGQKEEVLLLTKQNPSPPKGYTLIGGASNILLSPTPPPLAMLSKEFDYIKLEDGVLRVGAATPNGKVVSFCKKHNIANFEFLSHLPGKMGGAVKMNAGLKEYEVFNHLLHITTDNGVFAKQLIPHGYRYTKIDGVILEAAFSIQEGFSQEKVALFAKMRANQPKESSAGSCFKNPPQDAAGRLIEAVGLKGKQIGGMAFSPKHANFLVNFGNGTFQEAITLIEEAKEKVQQKFGIDLQEEIIIL